MPRTKKTVASKVRVERKEDRVVDQTFFSRVQQDLSNKNAILNIVLGALIVLVAGILIYNYTTKTNNNETTDNTQSQSTQASGDVSKDSLPGNYTVKEGDTLFNIAAAYYNDGYKYQQIAQANNITDVNSVTTGQVLNIPKLADTNASSQPVAQASSTPAPTANASPANVMDQAMGGATNMTEWGEKINSDTYTVVAGDWLSKIAGRAYGDIYSFDKIAKANNITNPDVIEPGTVLKIPR